MTQWFLLRCYLSAGHTDEHVMDEEIKRWSARRKSSLVLDILQVRR